jgi:hypothetical protein
MQAGLQDRSVIRLLRSSSGSLTPASLRLASKEPRRRTFMADVTVDGSGRERLLLDPIAADALAGQRAVLDFSFEGRQWWVAGPVEAVSVSAATLVVETGPTLRPARASRLEVAAQGTFALFATPELGEARTCESVLDLGPRGFRFESPHPLPVGTVLTQLVVLFRRDELRSGEGVVVSCAAVICADGRTVYEHGVRYRPARGPAAWAAGGVSEVTEIDDLTRARALFWGLCDLEHPIAISGPTGIVKGRLESIAGADRTRLPELRCRVQDEDRFPVRAGTVSVDCSLFGSGYRFFARIKERRDGVLVLSPAPKLREWHRRAEERTLFEPDADAMVSFRHPLSTRRRVRRLLDMSAGGLAFRALDGADGTEDEGALWDGLPLQDVRAHLPPLRGLPAATIRAPRVVVRSVAGARASAELTDLSDREAEVLRERLIALGSPDVHFDDGTNFDAIVAFHRSMGLLEPDMEANLRASLKEARAGWNRAHRRPDGLMRTVLVGWRGKIGATLTSVRAYERTWVLQHSAVASPAVPAGAGQLHGMLMRLAAHRADGDYVAGFIDASAKTLHATVDKFFTRSAPAHRGATGFSLYAAETGDLQGHAAAGAGIVIRPLRGRDEALVQNAALRLLDPVCVHALGLRSGEFALPATRAAYRRLGLARARRAFGAFRGERCIAILVQEEASPGLSLSGLLSSAMLLPVHPELDPEGDCRRALCAFARTGELLSGSPHRFLFAPAPVDGAPIQAAGYRLVGGCTFFALHRLGMLEYQRYVASRYGLLQARLRGRGARLPEAA